MRRQAGGLIKNTFLFVISEDRWNKKSHYFFTDYLSEFFRLEYLIILKSYEKEFLNTGLNCKKYKGVIFWGEIFNTNLVKNVKNMNIIFVPMMDYVHPKKLAWWYRLRQVKIICFTNFLHNQLSRHGFRTIHLQYYIKPAVDTIKQFDEKTLKKPLNVYTNTEITPKNQKIIDKLFKNTPYKVSGEINSNTHIFLSLNKFDGIENKMINAISSGLVLVGNNAPGFKDYVENNVSGFLYKMDLPLSIDFSNISEVQKKSIEKAKINAVKWTVYRKKLVDFLLKK